MRKLILSCLFLTCLVLAACAKPIPADRKAYVGEWRSETMSLLISQDGRVMYERKNGSASTSVDGPLKEFKGDDFIVGVGPLTTTFVVSAAPQQVAGQWKMTVDGVELTRAE
jgi:hypothetical protein